MDSRWRLTSRSMSVSTAASSNGAVVVDLGVGDGRAHHADDGDPGLVALAHGGLEVFMELFGKAHGWGPGTVSVPRVAYERVAACPLAAGGFLSLALVAAGLEALAAARLAQYPVLGHLARETAQGGVQGFILRDHDGGQTGSPLLRADSSCRMGAWALELGSRSLGTTEEPWTDRGVRLPATMR